MVLVGSDRFSVVLVDVVCSQWFFMVVMGSQKFLYVLIGSHRLSMVLTGFRRVLISVLIDILDVQLVIVYVIPEILPF